MTSLWSSGKCVRFNAGRSRVLGWVLPRPSKLVLQPSYQAHGVWKSCREHNRPGEGWHPPGVTAQEMLLEMVEASMKIALNWCSNP